jgi:hypothetical protein
MPTSWATSSNTFPRAPDNARQQVGTEVTRAEKRAGNFSTAQTLRQLGVCLLLAAQERTPARPSASNSSEAGSGVAVLGVVVVRKNVSGPPNADVVVADKPR